jgi:hypothetical protein
MNAKLRLENDAIRIAVADAARDEARRQPFNLSGRSHERRVTLDRRLATILRGQDIPRVFISGYGANYHYPHRVFESAAQLLKERLGALPIAFYEDTVYRVKND